MQRIGFIGLGLMGHGMAKNLVQKGHPLTFLVHRNRRNIADLVAAGANVVASDPEALETSRVHLEHVGLADKVKLTKDYYGACEGADALVVATEWLQYQSPDIDRIARSMKRRFVFDGRNVLSAAGFKQAGFKYRGIGRV